MPPRGQYGRDPVVIPCLLCTRTGGVLSRAPVLKSWKRRARALFAPLIVEGRFSFLHSLNAVPWVLPLEKGPTGQSEPRRQPLDRVTGGGDPWPAGVT